MPEAIVVGTDGSDSAKRAVKEAVRIARALGGELHVVAAFRPLRGAHVTGAPDGAAAVWQPLPDSVVEATLSEAAAAVRMSDVPVATHAVQKDPDDAILEIADKVGASMIVVGNRGMHGARRFALGNVPNKVSHRARCNVMIVATDRE